MKPKILSVGLAVPENSYTQVEASEWLGYTSNKPKSVFLNSEIQKRHFALPLEAARFNNFLKKDYLHKKYMESALLLSKKAISNCFETTSFQVKDVDLIVFATCTGYSCPALSFHIAKELGMKKSLQHANLYGMGCHAAVPAIETAHNYVVANPEKKALVVVTEIYSTTIYVDKTIETAVGNAIFADSSAALLIGFNRGSSNLPRATIMDFECSHDPEHIECLGYTFPDGKFRIRLSREIPVLIAPLMRSVASKLLERNALSKSDVKAWIVHPGGKRILENAEKALELSDSDLRFTRKIYCEYGNIAAVGVVFVLEEVMKSGEMQGGDSGVVLGMGPGLTATGILLQWI